MQWIPKKQEKETLSANLSPNRTKVCTAQPHDCSTTTLENRNSGRQTSQRGLLEFNLEVFNVQRLGNGLVGDFSVVGVQAAH
jgi:hypothetical protein